MFVNTTTVNLDYELLIVSSIKCQFKLNRTLEAPSRGEAGVSSFVTSLLSSKLPRLANGDVGLLANDVGTKSLKLGRLLSDVINEVKGEGDVGDPTSEPW
jgi:hypothetical protein